MIDAGEDGIELMSEGELMSKEDLDERNLNVEEYLRWSRDNFSLGKTTVISRDGWESAWQYQQKRLNDLKNASKISNKKLKSGNKKLKGVNKRLKGVNKRLKAKIKALKSTLKENSNG